MQLAEEQPNSHIDVAVHLGLSGWGRHEVAAALAFVQSHSPDVDLLALQLARQINRISRDSPHQVGPLACLARRGLAGSWFAGHYEHLSAFGRHHAALANLASSKFAR